MPSSSVALVRYAREPSRQAVLRHPPNIMLLVSDHVVPGTALGATVWTTRLRANMSSGGH